MFGDQKDAQNNLKDSSSLGITLKDTSITISYTKTNKLVTALYMVTDIIDTTEPLRNKLRTLGTGIISDMYGTPINALGKIAEIMSFLDIASAINIISEMNTNILRKEFLELNKAIKESIGENRTFNHPVDLSELFREELPVIKKTLSNTKFQTIGHPRSNSIGVQKGSTLLKALSQVSMSNKNNNPSTNDNFEILKKQRREDIINIIKNIGGNATIKDIKDKVKDMPEQAGFLVSCSEKTLQRELVSMVQSGVLKKAGEKRWSRYFVA